MLAFLFSLSMWFLVPKANLLEPTRADFVAKGVPALVGLVIATIAFCTWRYCNKKSISSKAKDKES
jgi:hypothetical protein